MTTPIVALLILGMAGEASAQQASGHHHHHHSDAAAQASSDAASPREVPESTAFRSLMPSPASNPASGSPRASVSDPLPLQTLSAASLDTGYYGYDETDTPSSAVEDDADEPEPDPPEDDFDDDPPDPPRQNLSGGASMKTGDVETACGDEIVRLSCSGRQGQALVACLLKLPQALSLDCQSAIRKLPALKAGSSVAKTKP